MEIQQITLDKRQIGFKKYDDKIHDIERLPEQLANSATILNNKGFFWDAADLALKAHQLTPNNLFQLEQTIHYCKNACKFHQVKELLDSGYPNKVHPHKNFITQVVYFMDENSITDSDLEKLIKIVMSIPHKHHLYQFGNGSTEMYLLEDEYTNWYHYDVKLHHLSVDEIVDLCFELSDTLAEVDLPPAVTNNFVPSFSLMDELTE